MEIYEKIKNIRESKKISQDYLAIELGLGQSQYSRRETGEVEFSPKQIKTISKLLDTSIANLFGEETITFNNNGKKVGNFGQYITTSEKLIEQYEFRLKEKDEIIARLQQFKSLTQFDIEI